MIIVIIITIIVIIIIIIIITTTFMRNKDRTAKLRQTRVRQVPVQNYSNKSHFQSLPT
jgi:flagellar basal body-associated protein FliL